jgi:hypothetical protein
MWRFMVYSPDMALYTLAPVVSSHLPGGLMCHCTLRLLRVRGLRCCWGRPATENHYGEPNDDGKP